MLDGFGVKVGLGRSRDANVIWSRWIEIVGDAIAAHAEPSSLRDGVLKVRADSPRGPRSSAIWWARSRLSANALIGRPAVTEVRIWTGPGHVSRDEKRLPAKTVPAAANTPNEATERPPAKDPQEALERAREAWRRRHATEGTDPREGS